jgi:hypothetical protein
MFQTASLSDLPGGARQVISKADKGGWWSIASVTSESVVVKGWKAPRQHFAALWQDGKAHRAYWWTTEHQATVSTTDGLRTEQIEWSSDQPLPQPIGIKELKRRL